MTAVAQALAHTLQVGPPAVSPCAAAPADTALQNGFMHINEPRRRQSLPGDSPIVLGAQVHLRAVVQHHACHHARHLGARFQPVQRRLQGETQGWVVAFRLATPSCRARVRARVSGWSKRRLWSTETNAVHTPSGRRASQTDSAVRHCDAGLMPCSGCAMQVRALDCSALGQPRMQNVCCAVTVGKVQCRDTRLRTEFHSVAGQLATQEA